MTTCSRQLDRIERKLDALAAAVADLEAALADVRAAMAGETMTGGIAGRDETLTVMIDPGSFTYTY